MAGRSEVVLEFVGDDSRLIKTLRNVEQRAGAALGAIGKMGKVGAGASGLLGIANTALTLGSALTTVAPAALALPGILSGIAVAGGTAKLALAGFGDAVGGDAEALAKLSPAARASAQAVRGLGAGFTAMRSAVQERFFAGLASEIKLTGAELLKVGTQQLPQVAAGLNGVAKEAIAAARTPFFSNGLVQVTDNTAAALQRMRMAGANLLTGLVGLSAVGSDYLPAIGAAADGAAARFRAWVDTAVEAGRINKMIDGAIEGFRQLGALLGAVGAVGATIWQGLNAGLGASATPLTLVTEKVNVLHAALQRPESQAALQMIGAAIAAVSAAFNAVLPVVISFAVTLATMLLPAVISLAGFIAQYPTVFTSVAVAIGAVVVAARLLIGVAAVVRGALQAWGIAQSALNVIMSLNPIGLVVIAIAALVAILILAWQNSETFRSVVLAAWEGVKAGAAALVAGVQAALAWFAGLPGLAAQWWGGFMATVLSIGASILSWAFGWPMKLGDAIANFDLAAAGRRLIEGFRRGLAAAWNAVVSWFQGQLAWFRGLFPFSPAKWGPFSGQGYVTHSGEALGNDFASSLAGSMPAVGRAAEGLLGAAALPLSGGAVAGAGLPAPAVASPAGGGSVRVELVAGAGADSGVATLIMQLVRTGKLQLRAVA